jgi:hypothetical protein
MSEIDEGLRMSWHASAGRMCAELQKLQSQNQIRIWTEGRAGELPLCLTLNSSCSL